MKLRIVIDKTREEEIIIYTHEKNDLTQKIQDLVEERESVFLAHSQSEVLRLTQSEVYCFVCENNKVFAVTDKDKFLIKTRLYKLEEVLGRDFIKINQSCIANATKIKRFDTSVSGTLKVIFKNGYSDYVSRRQIKTVKERLGI